MAGIFFLAMEISPNCQCKKGEAAADAIQMNIQDTQTRAALRIAFLYRPIRCGRQK
jgi:hypothetical protein